jgi:hypothetical protein
MLMLCVGWILGSCSNVEGGQPTPPPPIVAEARSYLADELGLEGREVAIVRAEEVEWPDSCLGLAEEGEFCAQVITEGWRVVLMVQDAQYEVHTDATGDHMRIQEP